MRLRVGLSVAGAAAACLLLAGCGKDFGTGFGESEGWGGYTKQFGDVDEGMDKPVGLCSYTGGCTPQGKIGAAKGWGTTGGSDDKDE